MIVAFVQEVCCRMRLDTMVFTWFKKQCANCCFCCREKSEEPVNGLKFNEAVRAWTVVAEWAPLGVHLYQFFLFGPPISNGARIHNEFWIFGLVLYIAAELLVEAILQFYLWAVTKYGVEVPLLPLKLPSFPSQAFVFWALSCGLVAGKQ